MKWEDFNRWFNRDSFRGVISWGQSSTLDMCFG